MTNVKRPYRSKIREAGAAQTREAIVGAMSRLLGGGPLAGITMESIAREAGVAVQTVYASFGSKAAILAALLDRLEADAEPLRLSGTIAGTGSMARQLRAIVGYHRRLFERGATVIEATVGATAVDPDIADHVAMGQRRRRAAQAATIRAWHARGALRPGLGIDEAADLLWALTSPQMYLLLVRDSGWSPGTYERRLAALLEAHLLMPGDAVAGAADSE